MTQTFGKRTLRLMSLMLLVGGLGMTAKTAHAQTTYNLTVNTTMDTHDVGPADGICNDASGKCSLRAAVEEANSEPQPAGTQTVANISVPPGTYALTLGELDLLRNTIVITGTNTDDSAVVSGNNASRVFYVNNDSSTLQNLTVTRGNGTGINGRAGQGGGIYSNTTFTLVNDIITGNAVTSAGRATSCTNSTANTVAGGGGLYQYGYNPLTIQSSTISNNTATATGIRDGAYACGGGLFDYDGTTTIQSSHITGNAAMSAYKAQGGGIYNYEQETISYSLVSNNTATAGRIGFGAGALGGGIYVERGSGGNGYPYVEQLISTSVTGNAASGTSPGNFAEGGGIYANGDIQMSGPAHLDNNTATAPTFAGGGGMEVDENGYLSNGVTVTGNVARATGAAGYIPRCNYTGNDPPVNACVEGGGISNYNYLNMQGVFVRQNQAIASVAPGLTGMASAGGVSDDGTGMTGQRVNISANSSRGTRAIGGGIYASVPLNLQNSYVQSNTATTYGGGIYDATVQFNNSTSTDEVALNFTHVTQNSAGNEGGGIYNQKPISQYSSQVAFNTAPLCPNIVVPCH